MAQISTSVPGQPVTKEKKPRFERILVWELPIRIFHWVNAAAIIVLFLTGLYIASPILSDSGEPWKNFLMARMRQIHFAAAFIFIIMFFLRIYWFWAGNEHARSGFPYVWRGSWWKDLFQQLMAYFRFDFGHPHLGHNALAGLSYTLFIIVLGWLQIFTGLALYSESDPEGFWGRLVGWVIPLFGGSFRTHMWHHMFAWMFIWFVIIHLYIIVLDSRMYRNGLIGSMITGMKFRRERAPDDTD
ncbi:MAG: Ni/Fe-hydrogenase, b-type cytochrome subunit [Planctomycetota bacterium]|jgi:Ni/Fe-hydrogenase 1 B-type cytochrome subunit